MTISILDIGCGYGRDVLYLSRHLKCKILGIDSSQEAIRIASEACLKKAVGNAEFLCGNFDQVGSNKYDIVFISNLYQLLAPDQRAKLRETVNNIVLPGGLVFLSTLSVSDPEHYGKGVRIVHEINSFLDEKYLHFCTREELEEDFRFLSIKELRECEYYESRATGETHHHISWLLAGRYSTNIFTVS
jgi:2-polyprenyl-3-methyl-5-hydroxy-6-metoxy-1,4-benzoquinol methylase